MGLTAYGEHFPPIYLFSINKPTLMAEWTNTIYLFGALSTLPFDY